MCSHSYKIFFPWISHQSTFFLALDSSLTLSSEAEAEAAEADPSKKDLMILLTSFDTGWKPDSLRMLLSQEREDEDEVEDVGELLPELELEEEVQKKSLWRIL